MKKRRGYWVLACVLLCCLLLVAGMVVVTRPASANREDPAQTGHEIVKTGIDILLEHPERLQGKKVGLITNPTGVTRDLTHDVDALLQKGVRLVAVYGPEHGVRGTQQAGKRSGFYRDPKTGLPFYDVYAKTPKQIAPLFAEVDVVLFDLQDVGVRYYTYISTMAYAMEAAALQHKPIWVLDRPNPLGGEKVEGPVLDPKFRSFVGLFPIPVRHGMTVGELAQLFNDKFLIGDMGAKADLHVIKMEGWHRAMSFEKTGLPWVLPSPNIPTVEAAEAYAATCLIEGTNLSEGRGTARPFQLIGADFVNSAAFAGRLRELHLPGVAFREAAFEPVASKFEGDAIEGIDLYITGRSTYDPIRTGLSILATAKTLYGDDFKWRSDEFVDLLLGTDRVRKGLDAGRSVEQLMTEWKPDLEAFKELRKPYLLYEPQGGEPDEETFLAAPASAMGEIYHLHAGSPEEAGMERGPIQKIDPLIQQAIEKKVMPGAVVLIARRGVIVKEQAYGNALQYAGDPFTPLAKPVPMKPDTIFDIASVSKLFTATAVMQLWDRRYFSLDDEVRKYLPEFAENGKEHVTIRQLLTHTSGFEPGMALYKLRGNREQLLQEVLRHPLTGAPGNKYEYSDLNVITLGALVERITGIRLDSYVYFNIFLPLGMKGTFYNPPAFLKNRIAATEYQPWTGRGVVWGQVHDESAWALGGVAGHAGVFSTARDLAVFGQMMLNGGVYGHHRILSESAVRLIGENQLPQAPGDDQGLGWNLNQSWYMDALSDSKTMGHTGFTGTSLVISPRNQTICIVLTNRVHPTRETASTNPVRRLVARQAALAIPVPMPFRDGAWFAGMGDRLANTLTAQIDLGKGGTLSFATWHRIEQDADFGYVEASADGVLWMPVHPSFTGAGDWISVLCDLPAGTRLVRFRYRTDEKANGRGWYVHAPKLQDEKGHDERATWEPNGWTMAKK